MSREAPEVLRDDDEQVAWRSLSVEPDEGSILSAVRSITESLGIPGRGRNGNIVEVVAPVSRSESHPRSLSRIHGEGVLPLHVEASHRSKPCRFLVLGCVNPGCNGSATTLLNWAQLGFTTTDVALLKAAPILVRSGRRSFYSTILPVDGAYLRYDPGCMEAVCERGRAAMALVEDAVANKPPTRYHWQAGALLVIDNWRALHGREDATFSVGRKLVRMTVNA